MNHHDVIIDKRKTWFLRGTISVCIICFALGTWWYLSDAKPTLTSTAVANTADTSTEMPPALVTTVTAESGKDTSLIWLPGTVVSAHDARIAAEQSGRITWIAELGAMIDEGAVIAKLDDRELELQRADNESQINSLQSQLSYQQNQLQRMQRLSQDNSIAANQLEENTTQVEQLQQQLRQAEIALKRTNLQIKQTQVLAPFSGQLVNRMVQLGEHVNTSTVVARLVDIEEREIRVQVPVTLANNLQNPNEENHSANVSIRSSDNSDYTDTVVPIKFIMAVADEASRMMEMRVDANSGEWQIGSAVQVGVQQSDHLPEVTIPRDALVLRGDRQFIYKVNESGAAEQVDVSTGIGLGERIEVFGSIEPGDKVILRGAERLQPGQTLEILDSTT